MKEERYQKLIFEEHITLPENKLPYVIQQLEQEPIITSNQNNEFTEDENIPFECASEYLYHGIRFQKYLEKLENIFKEKKILAGKYIKNYHHYSDNCNKGEYVSLLKYTRKTQLEYELLVLSNISLLITPLCNAVETKYVNFQTWRNLQKEQYQLKHLYSYMQGEYLCKDFVPIEMVKAIGFPYQLLRLRGKAEYADNLIKDIKTLMEKYDIYLPIVDTSRYNAILYAPNTREFISYTRKRKNLW